ncbi:UNVERIFIED_CONTAM: hypothetical protein H355_005480 [Colinus virginianus]|nr:hypothetical protein H355_005480 [Colinus virginianus]
MADASDAFAAAAVSALCWVPQGSAAAQPRSYLLEAQDRQALGSRLQKQQRRRRLQGRRRGAAGRLRVQQQQKMEARRGRRGRSERAAEDKGEEHAAAGASEMQVDDDEEEEEDKKDEDEEEAASSEVESMDATDGEEEDDDGKKERERYTHSGWQQEQVAADGEEEEESQHLFGVVREDGPATLNDPYLKLDGGEDSEEEEANRVLPTDLLLVAANAEQDCSSLEVYVYDDESGGFYVHHDILVSTEDGCVACYDVRRLKSSAGLDPAAYGQIHIVFAYSLLLHTWVPYRCLSLLTGFLLVRLHVLSLFLICSLLCVTLPFIPILPRWR